MKIFGLFFILMIFFLGNVFAQCSDGQININTASETDFDKITYVGPATAAKIISARPFDSVNDLINVSGIGETKLNAIKNQNLACVEDSGNEEEKEETKIETINKSEEIPIETPAPKEDLAPEIKELQVIKLNSKDIKDNNSIQENKEGISTEKYASFGLMALCILVLILLFLQRKKDGLA